jgi:hypothetical protein
MEAPEHATSSATGRVGVDSRRPPLTDCRTGAAAALPACVSLSGLGLCVCAIAGPEQTAGGGAH